MNDENVIHDENLFARLKRIREEKQIDLNELAKTTRIQVKYLEAIEQGSLGTIPEIYDRLFFQTYIQHVCPENDPTGLIDEFNNIRAQIKQPAAASTGHFRRYEVQPEAPGSRQKMIYILSPVALGLFILIYMAFRTTAFNLPSAKQITEISVQDVEKSMRPQAMLTDSAKVDSTARSAKFDKLLLRLVARDTTWLRSVADHTDTSEYLLKPGNSVKLSADSVFTFLVGNAAGLELFIGDSSVGVLGRKSQVIQSLTVTRNGIQSVQKKKN